MSRFSRLKRLFRRRRKEKDGPESSQPPEPQRTFPQFVRLPPELRLQIWHHAMPAQVLYFTTPSCEMKCIPPDLLRFSHLQSPILNVCREARDSRISYYKTTFQFRSHMESHMPREPIYWDPNTDLVVLVRDPEHHLHCELFANGQFYHKPTFHMPLSCMDSRVRFLGFEVGFERKEFGILQFLDDEEWDLHLNGRIKEDTGLGGWECMFLILRDKKNENRAPGIVAGPWINTGWSEGGLDYKTVRGVQDALRKIERKI